MLLQTQNVGEIVAGQFDKGFPDLVCSNGHRMFHAFDDRDTKLRLLLLELDRQRQSGEPATQNDELRIGISV